MGERPAPEIKVIHPEVEILGNDLSGSHPAPGGSRIWLSVDANGGTRRVFVTKPGPITTFLLLLAFGALLTVSVVVAFFLFAFVAVASAVAVTGLLIYGFARRALTRLR
jgi:hypothetical protein